MNVIDLAALTCLPLQWAIMPWMGGKYRSTYSMTRSRTTTGVLLFQDNLDRAYNAGIYQYYQGI